MSAESTGLPKPINSKQSAGGAFIPEHSTFKTQTEPHDSIEKKAQSLADKTLIFLEKTGIYDIVSDENKFNQWLQDLTFETALDYLVRINGLIRGKKRKDRSVDGEKVIIQGQMGGGMGHSFSEFLPPQEKDKQVLLEKTFLALKEITSSQDRARLIYYALQAIHLFSDGNGRLGRLIYYIFSNIGRPEAFMGDKLIKLISHKNLDEVDLEGRKEIAQEIPVPEKFFRYPRELVGYNDLSQDFTDSYPKGIFSALMSDEGYGEFVQQLNPETRKALLAIIEGAEGRWMTLDVAFVKFLLDNNIPLDKYKRTTQNPLKFYNFIGTRLLADLDNSQAQEIIDNFWKLKYGFVLAIIEMFRDPELESYKNEACKL